MRRRPAFTDRSLPRRLMAPPLARLVAALVLAATVLPFAAVPIAAQEETGLVDETSYESPQFGYEVAWDDPWAADEDATASEEGGSDILVLVSDDPAGTTLTVEGVASEDEPAAFLEERLDAVAEEFAAEGEVVTDVASTDLPEDGDIAAGTATFTDGGDEVEAYFEVGVVERGASLRLVTVRAPAGDLEAAASAAQAVVTIDGDPIFGGPAPSDDDAAVDDEDEASPEADDAADDAADDDQDADDEDAATAEPDDDTTAAADEDAADEDATEEPEDDATAAADEDEDTTGDDEDATGDEPSDDDLTATAQAEDEDAEDEDAQDDDDATATAEAEEDEADEDADATATAEAEEEDENEGTGGGVDGSTYTSPTYGFTLEWDEDDWEPTSDESTPDGDFLSLQSPNSGLSFQAFEGFNGDPTECLEGITDFFEQDGTAGDGTDFEVTDLDPLEDEDGEVIEGEDGDRVFAAFTRTLSFEDGEEVELAAYGECRPIVEDQAVLVVIFSTLPEDYADEFPLAEEVIDTIELDGAPPADDEPADDEETAEPEDEETPEADEEETPDADEEPSDEDATATAEAEEEDEDDEPVAGLETYDSPTYGYSVSYDPEVWEAEDASQGGTDQLVLNAGPSQLLFLGIEDYDGDSVACVNDQLASIRGAEGVSSVENAVDETGNRVSGGSESRFFARFVAEVTGGTFASTGTVSVYIECRTIEEGESVVIVQHVVQADYYESEAPKVEEVLATLEVS